jgi:hypothetical protein
MATIDLSALGIGNPGAIDWAAYFDENHAHRLVSDFSREVPLTADEKRLIFPSVRRFQKGEASDGRCLLACAEAYVRATGDTAYLPAIRGFIREENRHSAYLKSYMDYYGVAPASRVWLDRIFRRLRRGGSLKREITVLVTAEMLALSYYAALSRCTASPVLRRICAQMLHDESRHIVFQSWTLHKIGVAPGDVRRRHRLLRAAANALWLGAKPVFAAAGDTRRGLLAEAEAMLAQSAAIAATGTWA